MGGWATREAAEEAGRKAAGRQRWHWHCHGGCRPQPWQVWQAGGRHCSPFWTPHPSSRRCGRRPAPGCLHGSQAHSLQLAAHNQAVAGLLGRASPAAEPVAGRAATGWQRAAPVRGGALSPDRLKKTSISTRPGVGMRWRRQGGAASERWPALPPRSSGAAAAAVHILGSTMAAQAPDTRPPTSRGRGGACGLPP